MYEDIIIDKDTSFDDILDMSDELNIPIEELIRIKEKT